MYIQIATVFLTIISLITCDLEYNEKEKSLTKRGIVEVFNGNSKFHHAFWNQNPDETLSRKFLGQETLTPISNFKVFQYNLPLVETTPIKYDYSRPIYEEEDTLSFSDEDASFSSDEDTSNVDITFDVNRVNPIPIFNVVKCNNSKDDAVKNNEKLDVPYKPYNLHPFGSNVENHYHQDEIFLWPTTEDPRFSFYFENEAEREPSSTSTNKHTDIVTDSDLNFNKRNSSYTKEETSQDNKILGAYSNLNTSGATNSFHFGNKTDLQSSFTSKNTNTETKTTLTENMTKTDKEKQTAKDTLISNDFRNNEFNRNKMNMSNLLISQIKEDKETSESTSQRSITKSTNELEAIHVQNNVNKQHTGFNKTGDVENSVLYTSTIYGSKPSTYSGELNPVQKESLKQIDLKLERINNILDRLQEKTYNLEKTIQNTNKPNDHHSNLYDVEKNKNYHRYKTYPEYNVYQNTHQSKTNYYHYKDEEKQNSNRHTGPFGTLGTWFTNAKNGLANVIVNSFDEGGDSQGYFQTSSSPKYFPKIDENVMVIPKTANSESLHLPQKFPNKGTVVVPPNLQINDSPLGPLGERDVKTLRLFFNNDFEKKNWDWHIVDDTDSKE